MKYNKQPISIADQIVQLKSRGLIMEDDTIAEKVLSIISYFRFASYLRPMEADRVTHSFKTGKKFSNAVDLYYFDKELRGVIFLAIQTVEVALRTSVIQHFSMKYGPFWFMKSKLFKDGEMHKACLKTIRAELKRSKEDFIKEHFAKYDRPSMPPSWKTLEVVSFGTLGKLYSNFADTSIKKTVARSFNVPNHEVLDSWVAALAALRNCCAHHARTWNRKYPMKPQMPDAKKMRAAWVEVSAVDPSRLYALLCCLIYWVNNIQPGNSIKNDIVQLMKKHPNVDPSAMGFPDGWEKEALWK
ncbi:MAG: Abi family protein [Bacteroidales bacterium]|nr:Abi family protein [Bacteroidales bacterium]